jgi:hypothetical protein
MHDKFPNAKPTGCKFLRKPQGSFERTRERYKGNRYAAVTEAG